MAQANTNHETVTNALAKLDAWLQLYSSGDAPTHKRQILMDILYSATNVTAPAKRGEPGFVFYGPAGVELANTEFSKVLKEHSVDFTDESAKRGLIVKLVDRMVSDVRDDTEPATVFGQSFSDYDPTWVDENEDQIEDVTQVPQILTPPTVAGTQEEGEELTVTTGVWTGPTPEYTYQWYRDSRAIEGATSNAYTLAETTGAGTENDPVVPGDAGTNIQVRVTAVNPNGSNSWTSAPLPIAELGD